jgi:hypothetical protein
MDRAVAAPSPDQGFCTACPEANNNPAIDPHAGSGAPHEIVRHLSTGYPLGGAGDPGALAATLTARRKTITP